MITLPGLFSSGVVVGLVGSTGPADGPAALGLPVVGPGALTGASVAASGTRLTGRLVPDHKTIADFRKDNGGAIRQVCVRFVALCRAMGLLTESSVAIDGSKFKAVNNRDKNFTRAKMDRRMAQIGTKLPIRDVRRIVAMGWKADSARAGQNRRD